MKYQFDRALPIAMWDFTWLERHHAGGSFADFDRVIDELVERGYEAVRIDVFPHLIAADQQGNILGETGLVRENMYVRTVQLSVPVHDKQPVSMKVMAYEPETYQSLGAVALNTTLAVEK